VGFRTTSMPQRCADPCGYTLAEAFPPRSANGVAAYETTWESNEVSASEGGDEGSAPHFGHASSSAAMRPKPDDTRMTAGRIDLTPKISPALLSARRSAAVARDGMWPAVSSWPLLFASGHADHKNLWMMCAAYLNARESGDPELHVCEKLFEVVGRMGDYRPCT
jgi:hypothetical protein